MPARLRWVAAAAMFAGCAHGDTAPSVLPDATPLRGVDFLAQLAVLDTGALTADVHVTNRRGSPVALEFPDACPALLRAYEADGGRVAVWDQRQVAECEGDPARLEIGGGAVAVLRVPHVGLDRVLGDSLPPGSYRFTVYLRPGGQVVEVAAGTADLARD
ncbi:MAG TPA: hypothetical protein VM778_08245 [Gemmatimonadota bacterium]|nr:hypothetical protein [Gemmatimonadota bacterium]